MKSRAPQLHLEYRFYKQLGHAGRLVNVEYVEMSLVVIFTRNTPIISRYSSSSSLPFN